MNKCGANDENDDDDENHEPKKKKKNLCYSEVNQHSKLFQSN